MVTDDRSQGLFFIAGEKFRAGRIGKGSQSQVPGFGALATTLKSQLPSSEGLPVNYRSSYNKRGLAIPQDYHTANRPRARYWKAIKYLKDALIL